MSDASFITATRDSYSATAVEYLDWLRDDLDHRPLDRALFAAFAELVRAGGNRPVLDVGCGPGRRRRSPSSTASSPRVAS